VLDELDTCYGHAVWRAPDPFNENMNPLPAVAAGAPDNSAGGGIA